MTAVGKTTLVMDPLAHRLGELESGIERTTVPPPGWPASPIDLTAGMQPPTVGAPPAPRSPDPPLPEWGEVLGHVEMRPPLAARPYLVQEGLSRQGYRPRVGSNTGALGRYCSDGQTSAVCIPKAAAHLNIP